MCKYNFSPLPLLLTSEGSLCHDKGSGRGCRSPFVTIEDTREGLVGNVIINTIVLVVVCLVKISEGIDLMRLVWRYPPHGRW